MPSLINSEFVFFFNWEILVKNFVVFDWLNSWKHVMSSIIGSGNHVNTRILPQCQMLKPTLAEPLNQTAPSNLYKSQKLLLLDSAPNEFHLMKKDNLAEDAIKHRVDDWLGDLGWDFVEKKSIISLKFSLTRKINAPKKKLSDFEKLQFLNNEINQNINFVKLPNDNSIFLHSGLNSAWHFWLSTIFSCCLKMKSVENILGNIREQF